MGLTGEHIPFTLFIIISFRLQSAGRTVALANPGGTSKTCSGCGWVKKDLNPPDRIFHCDSCGLEIGRDLNAPINICNRGMEKLGRGTPEFTPVETGALPARATSIAEAGSPVHQGGEDVTIRMG